MGFVYEVVCKGTDRLVSIANVYHIWDGDENQTPDDVADVFENNLLVDLAVQQVTSMTWNQIAVRALDVGNGLDPINRAVSIVGSAAGDAEPTGLHAWIKFLSDDNGFKSGGKLIAALSEAQVTLGVMPAVNLAAFQTIFDDLITDLGVAGLALAIYRPSLSTPGFPNISICSTVLARGIGSNNRRQQPFQV